MSDGQFAKKLAREIASDWSLFDRLNFFRNIMISEYYVKNPNSAVAYEEACKYLPGGNTRSVLYYSPFPLSFVSGHDCYVVSADNDEYLDLVSEYSAALFGHSHPDILKAICNATTLGLNLGGPGNCETDLAKHIVSRFEKSIEQVRFCNSGTEANTMALAVALNYTNRKKILVFKGGYHGGSITFRKDGLPTPTTIPHEWVIGPYNDIQTTKLLLSKDIAAILVEPMQGAGGMIPATREFLQFLRDSATQTGAILIFDEIVTSRLHYNGLQGYHGIYPDITTLGKYIGGGLSFGAFGGSKTLMSLLDHTSTQSIAHSGTFNNNRLSMAAGVAAAGILTVDKINNLNALGNRLREDMQKILQEGGLSFFRASGFGSAIGLHFDDEEIGDLWQECFFFFCISRGLYTGRRGFCSLNLLHEVKHIDQVLEVVKDFLKLVSSYIIPRDDMVNHNGQVS
jgi:glutamate-1-semialdehyde 2,1-aminomutase